MNVLEQWFAWYCLACLDLAAWFAVALYARGWLAYLAGALGFVSAWTIAIGVPMLIWFTSEGMLNA